MPCLTFAYTVQSGDTISDILFRLQPTDQRIYGKKGNLQKTLQLNPQLASLGVIRPGDEIKLPEFVQRDTAAVDEPDLKAAAPAPAVIAPEGALSKKSEYAGSSLMVDARLGIANTAINSTDPQGHSAKLVSPATAVAEIQLRQSHSPNWQSGILISGQSLSFADSPSSIISKKKISLVSFAAEGRYLFSDATEVSLGIGSMDRAYLLAPVTGTVDVYRTSALGATLAFRQSFGTTEHSKMGYELKAISVFPTSQDAFNTKTNPGGSAQIFSQYFLKNRNLIETRLGYDWERQDTNLSNQQMSQIYVGFGLTLFFKEDSK